MKLNILCIGDIVGRPGRRIIADKLKALVKERSIDCVIANAENAAGGSGLTPQIYNKLLRYAGRPHVPQAGHHPDARNGGQHRPPGQFPRQRRRQRHSRL